MNSLVKQRVVNGLFLRAPAGLITLRHEVKHRKKLAQWLCDDLMFVHIPKSGGTSIARALGRSEPGHFTYREMESRAPANPNRIAYFVLRDPVDRIVSAYYYLLELHRQYGTSTVPEVVESTGPDDFVLGLKPGRTQRHYFLRPVSTVLAGAESTRVIAVNFDDLDKNLSHFWSEFAGASVPLGHHNAVAGRPSTDLSTAARLHVSALYPVDTIWYEKLRGQRYARLADLD